MEQTQACVGGRKVAVGPSHTSQAAGHEQGLRKLPREETVPERARFVLEHNFSVLLNVMILLNSIFISASLVTWQANYILRDILMIAKQGNMSPGRLSLYLAHKNLASFSLAAAPEANLIGDQLSCYHRLKNAVGYTRNCLYEKYTFKKIISWLQLHPSLMSSWQSKWLLCILDGVQSHPLALTLAQRQQKSHTRPEGMSTFSPVGSVSRQRDSPKRQKL